MNDRLQLPKVELHCHLEGTMPPPLVRRLATRNGIQLTDGLFDNNDQFVWTNFSEFLKAYDGGARCLRTGQDYHDITYEYLSSCAQQGAIYVELFASPDHAAAVGISYTEMLEGCVQAIDNAQRDHQICGRIIITCVRHLGPGQALSVAQQMVAEPHPYVVGFGMGGDETLHSPQDFLPAYRIASDAGYGCTAHAGEVCGPESVWAAIDQLPVTRIGHGVRSIEDPKLLEALYHRNIALEICPGSNIALNVYPDYSVHPLLALLDAGISLSLNSDDPPFFWTSIGKEYQRGASTFQLSEQQLLKISCMALKAAFVDEETKSQLLLQLKN
ncbi:adenosine deaminase [Motiliproteus sp. MSK22-1]|uniref:adenosine deaminase n=1 Tax=Motiliproteus sp. MSK22-1 TaxID=1897630 RepID=UPI000976E3FD|nr:adenosine deaminase [Motiliproteus sp. MSK22-1]OMH32175.1 adenosine deaminase [Motiliproteus sp. MSK22-1]